MALTEAQRQALMAEAQERGLNEAEFIADAEAESASEDGDEKPDSAETTGPNGKGEVGFYSFQYPFLTVNEIRESLGLPAIGDGGKFSGEWLVSHGGAPKAPAGGDGEA